MNKITMKSTVAIILFFFPTYFFGMSYDSHDTIIFSDTPLQKSTMSRLLNYGIALLGIGGAIAHSYYLIKSKNYFWHHFAPSSTALILGLLSLSKRDILFPFSFFLRDYERKDAQYYIDFYNALYSKVQNEDDDNSLKRILVAPNGNRKTQIRYIEETLFNYSPLMLANVQKNSSIFQTVELHGLMHLKVLADREINKRLYPIIERYKAQMPFYERIYYWLTNKNVRSLIPLQENLQLYNKIKILIKETNTNEIDITRYELIATLMPYLLKTSIQEELNSYSTSQCTQQSAQKEKELESSKKNQNSDTPRLDKTIGELNELYNLALEEKIYKENDIIYIPQAFGTTAFSALLGKVNNLWVY